MKRRERAIARGRTGFILGLDNHWATYMTPASAMNGSEPVEDTP